jgi:beta-1,4-mannosyltransferase
MRNFGILAWPAYSTRHENPYNYLIYNKIEAKGYPVCEFSGGVKAILKSGFSSKYRIVHLHWPINSVLSVHSRAHAQKRFFAFYLIIRIAKLLKKKIVWTVHNLQEHDSRHPDLQQKLEKILYSYVDGFISLNKQGLEIIKENATNYNKQKFSYIPHPHYKNYYPNQVDREAARKSLNISPEKFVFLFIGQIRMYKNVIGLINAFKNMPDKNILLVIAGKVHKEYEQELKNCLINASNIILYNSFVKDDALQLFLNSADLVVTPYEQIFNSGSVFLNLSFNKPTLAPDLWALSELNHTVGSLWVKTYKGPISAEVLEKSMKEVCKEETVTQLSQPDIDSFDPASIANQTLAFYKLVLGET